jgi:thiol-disulfide isomerase/thioredoxin
MKAFHKKVNTSNARFNKLMHAYIDLDIIEQAEYFLYTPRKEHPTTEQTEEMAPFYKDFVDNNVFKTTIILDLPKGISALSLNDMYYISNVLKVHMADGPAAPQTQAELDADTEEAQKERAARLADFFKRLAKVQGSSIKNDTLKAFYVLEELPKYKSYNKEYADFMKPYRQYIELSDYVKTKVEAFEATIRTTGAGSPGINFTYKDINDKEVSFADLRGKVVYIDVWATWCAPCKQEIPYLKKLEEEFKGKDIQFVSISMDKPKHHEKWKKFVEDNELTGIQLFADNAFDSKLAKDYQINSIPRFLLFDKDGLIVNADAIRPSNPDLKGLLEDLLK